MTRRAPELEEGPSPYVASFIRDSSSVTSTPSASASLWIVLRLTVRRPASLADWGVLHGS